jgi:hypothetical protein
MTNHMLGTINWARDGNKLNDKVKYRW